MIFFLSWSRCSNRSAGINFNIFCSDHGVVNVVNAGIKIYVFCHYHVVINVVGVMT